MTFEERLAYAENCILMMGLEIVANTKASKRKKAAEDLKTHLAIVRGEFSREGLEALCQL